MSDKQDKFGKPLDLYEWSELFEDYEYKRIGSRYLWNGYYVSTVWLGLDHGFGGTPLWFETMVFSPKWLRLFGKSHDVYCRRYTTYHQAEQGHEETVAKFMPWYQRLFNG